VHVPRPSNRAHNHLARQDAPRPRVGLSPPESGLERLRISPLHEAARKGDVREAEKLLEAGADLTARDEHVRSTPLAWAAKYGQLEMVEFLLRRGAPKSLPDDPSWATPPAWAIRRGHEKIARLLS
jgi:ankyrin repeat protein